MDQHPRLFVKSWAGSPSGSWATLIEGDRAYGDAEFIIEDRTERMCVNIKLTGRTIQYHIANGSWFVSCEIEFVKDGEENVLLRGAYVEVEVA